MPSTTILVSPSPTTTVTKLLAVPVTTAAVPALTASDVTSSTTLVTPATNPMDTLTDMAVKMDVERKPIEFEECDDDVIPTLEASDYKDDVLHDGDTATSGLVHLPVSCRCVVVQSNEDESIPIGFSSGNTTQIWF